MQTVTWNERNNKVNPIFPGKLQIYCYEHLFFLNFPLFHKEIVGTKVDF